MQGVPGLKIIYRLIGAAKEWAKLIAYHTEKELQASEIKYRTLYYTTNYPIMLMNTNTVIECNPQTLGFFKCTQDLLTTENALFNILSPAIQPDGEDSYTKAQRIIHLALTGNPQVFEWQHMRLDNTLVDCEVRLNSFMLGNEHLIQAAIYDISEKKRTEAELRLQQGYFQQLFENSPQGIVMTDNYDGIIMVNKGFETMFGYTQEEILGRNINEIVAPGKYLEEAHEISRDVIQGNVLNKETTRKRKNGSLIHVSILGYPIVVNGIQLGVYGIYNDITLRKQAEDKLKYISLHDPLTGLYNRAYFEQKLQQYQRKYPEKMGIIACDIDGLKIINDTLGHDAGDAVLVSISKIITGCLKKRHILSRIGGDEFAIILPDADKKEVENTCRRINARIERHNIQGSNLHLHVSIGFAVLDSDNRISVNDLFKEADNNMYREKLHQGKSARSSIVQTLMTALEVRDYITEGHAERLQVLVQNMARALKIPERTINELRLLAQFHDIGKVGIPDRILNKKGPLTPQELKIMQRHSEIGARIAQSAPELAPIGDWILKHHEWWNGEGYPLGLKGEEIPLECRILSIADAYDSMTSWRPYRNAMTHEEGRAEILRCSGTQFDPFIVEKTIDILYTYSDKAEKSSG